jgi:alpha-beta hydrolase superfamily lysophospholipase
MRYTSSLRRTDAGVDTTVLSPFTTYDGHNLAVYDWSLPSGRRPRAAVLIVHGLGEHAWRYNTLANELNAAGFVVRAHDQRGHGDSTGDRGRLPHADTFLRDLAEVIEDTRQSVCRRDRLPLILLGHSMGGLVAAMHVARQLQGAAPALPVEALVLSSPALQVTPSPWQRLQLAVFSRLAPDLVVPNGVDPAAVSHDPEVVRAYRDDPRIHHRISPRLGRFLLEGGAEVMAQAPRWGVPTLLMYAGQDLLVEPGGSRRFAALAPPEAVQAHCFEGFYHELFNEVNRLEVVERLLRWLDQRF